MDNLFRYVVLGGGTAGWLTALYVKENFPYSDVTVIASSEIGILGAGEGTTPPFINFLKEINISFDDIVTHAKGTIKKGIKFTNWSGNKKQYFHNFESGLTQGNTALHFDANLLAKYLQSKGLERGIKLIDKEVTSIQGKDNITGLILKDNSIVPLDFVFDCSGFKRLIIGKHYNTPWKSYQSILPVNRAMPFFLENNNKNLPEYTEAIAMKHGWMWKIPVQGRYGCGYVFDKSHATDEEIKNEIEEYLNVEIISPRMFSFDAGCYETTWINNCVAIGLSSGFAEPLEATSIWIQTESIQYLLKSITGIISNNINAKKGYNLAIQNMNSEIANFLHFHYLTERDDTNFWNSFNQNERIVIPPPNDNILTFSDWNWNSIANGINYEFT